MSRPRSPGTALLGISCDYHDAAAALVIDGEIVAAAEEERFSRQKHDRSTPIQASRSCLDIAGISAADIDEVVFYEKPIAIADRFLTSHRRMGPSGVAGFFRHAPELATRQLMIGPRLAAMMRRLGAPRAPTISFIDHHRSHAASAFFPSPFDHAAVVVADGLGEWATITIGHGSCHRLRLIEEQRFPDSIGLMYSMITAWCGFRPLDDEYKVMGLAPYGTDRFADALAELSPVGPSGEITVDGAGVKWFGRSAFRDRRLCRLFDGPPRDPTQPLTAREFDLAASVQAFTERAMLSIARRAHEATGEKDLCLAGGVALNCVANGRLLRESPFTNLWVQPASGDSGGALGAALARWHAASGPAHARVARTNSMSGSMLGPHVATATEVMQACEERCMTAAILDDDTIDARTAEQLASGAVVGWCQGRMEFGPRALGNRSILADPRDPSIRGRLNAAIKQRESFRPFAPAVLAERASDWFELVGPSPYMLIVAPVRDRHLRPPKAEPEGLDERAAERRSTIPGCTHVDGSARVQTVHDDVHGRFAQLLRAFDRQTGCPILLNTSFNRAGQPIVRTTAEMLDTAIEAGLDLLVIGNVAIDLGGTNGPLARGGEEPS
ncbi:MAG TPA: carbamoyltransferase C-terminal domain-containing protein [Microthrixaceae bacterium]|jgi:carbamoyltransferase|nr:carbamoyltransferase C-terminal domain-containing protein [Microthrixaceae bacterium]HMT24674.1 carbamoyltransferase C-terminal domain-containing protein [Microthrixaceae bacterium]HMT60695.1 carbamoyltransferase C-terminal domain-containing protein [Microthrixaceae bacterium]